MKNYEVAFKYEGYKYFTVEAKDEDDAENIAFEMLLKETEPVEGEYTHTEVEEL